MHYTGDMIAQRFEEAYETQIAMVSHGVWPAKFRSAMPEPINDFNLSYGALKYRERVSDYADRPPRPTREQISRLDEVLGWQTLISEQDRHILWARAAGIRWRAICKRFRISRSTANRRWLGALIDLAEAVNKIY